MSYEIILLKTAHIACSDRVIYKNGGSDSATIIGCHCFLLQRNGQYYLIDTGIEDLNIANSTKSSKADWSRHGGEHDVKENLALLGIGCDQISKVFLTHAHYDHISGAARFKNARFYMTRTEYKALFSETNTSAVALRRVKRFLTWEKVVLFDEEMLVDDIRLKLRGGHTKGSMTVETGGFLFTGDTVFIHNNLDKKIPPGYAEDRETADRLLPAYLKYRGKIVTSHDYNEVI